MEVKDRGKFRKAGVGLVGSALAVVSAVTFLACLDPQNQTPVTGSETDSDASEALEGFGLLREEPGPDMPAEESGASHVNDTEVISSSINALSKPEVLGSLVITVVSGAVCLVIAGPERKDEDDIVLSPSSEVEEAIV